MSKTLSPLDRKKALMEKFKKEKTLKYIPGEEIKYKSFDDLNIKIKPEVIEWYQLSRGGGEIE